MRKLLYKEENEVYQICIFNLGLSTCSKEKLQPISKLNNKNIAHLVQSPSFTCINFCQNDPVSNLFSASLQWHAEQQWFGAVQDPEQMACSLC